MSAVPVNVAVPLARSVKVNPVGREPDRAIAGGGEPTVARVNENGVPGVAVADAAVVNCGARVVVRENACVVTPPVFVAVNVSGKVLPAVAMAAVPDKVAVPLAPGVKVIPVGKAPVNVITAAGEPVVVIANENGLPTTAFADAALVNCGAWVAERVNA